jgi:hypothetical protein
MMKKFLLFLAISLCLSVSHASKFSKYLNKVEENDRAQQEREWREDMNFSDFSFRLDKRYTDARGQRCRDYVFRSRNNPYRHGFYSVCDER